jgi:hypothetical protein
MVKDEDMKIPQRRYPYNWDRSQNALMEDMVLEKKRFEIESVTSEDPYLTASIKDFPENRPEQTDTEFLAILESIKELAIKL